MCEHNSPYFLVLLERRIRTFPSTMSTVPIDYGWGLDYELPQEGDERFSFEALDKVSQSADRPSTMSVPKTLFSLPVPQPSVMSPSVAVDSNAILQQTSVGAEESQGAPGKDIKQQNKRKRKDPITSGQSNQKKAKNTNTERWAEVLTTGYEASVDTSTRRLHSSGTDSSRLHPIQSNRIGDDDLRKGSSAHWAETYYRGHAGSTTYSRHHDKYSSHQGREGRAASGIRDPLYVPNDYSRNPPTIPGLTGRNSESEKYRHSTSASVPPGNHGSELYARATVSESSVSSAVPHSSYSSSSSRRNSLTAPGLSSASTSTQSSGKKYDSVHRVDSTSSYGDAYASHCNPRSHSGRQSASEGASRSLSEEQAQAWKSESVPTISSSSLRSLMQRLPQTMSKTAVAEADEITSSSKSSAKAIPESNDMPQHHTNDVGWDEYSDGQCVVENVPISFDHQTINTNELLKKASLAGKKDSESQNVDVKLQELLFTDTMDYNSFDYLGADESSLGPTEKSSKSSKKKKATGTDSDRMLRHRRRTYEESVRKLVKKVFTPLVTREEPPGSARDRKPRTLYTTAEYKAAFLKASNALTETVMKKDDVSVSLTEIKEKGLSAIPWGKRWLEKWLDSRDMALQKISPTTSSTDKK